MAISTFRRLSATLAFALACALANTAAHAQFSFPYDPDFPEEFPTERYREEVPLPDAVGVRPAERKAPEKKPPAAAPPTRPAVEPEARPPAPTPEAMRKAGPFLLMDRTDPGRIFKPEPSAEPPKDFGEFVLDLDPFRVDQTRWNIMRDKCDRGTCPTEEFDLPPLAPPFEVASASATAPPTPPPPEVELPTYGTSLSITGRKVIGFTFSEKRYLHPQTKSGRPASTNLIDIEQQLQLRMQGKVGPKITVNVDYDDTKPDKQDISVVYTGDPNEVVQNASFGDIDLSLPATEFVSYNKQLFGIRVEIQWKQRLRAIFIGSRTKGTTKTKQFRGNTQFITQDILDINYYRRRYYDLTFGNSKRLPITPGSERIYLSQETSGQPNVDEQTLTVDDLNVPTSDPYYFTSTNTATFRQLSPGIDYTIDYVDGVITFKNVLDESYIVAVDFTDASGVSITNQASVSTGVFGGSGLLKRIKTFADVAVSSHSPTADLEVGHKAEIKTFYNLGRTQILRDDGRGNFFLKVLDQNRSEVVPKIVVPTGEIDDLRYPDTVEVDFENGIFQLTGPFAVEGDTSTVDAEIYAPAPITKRQFQVEYRFRLKTFFLEPSLVLQSEIVLLDGVRLTRNSDYFIDYESGFLTFFNENRIRTDSVIDVSYEVAPFAGLATESLLGTRVSYEIFKGKWAIGSTLLYQTGAKAQTVPTINELAESLLVYEVDTQLTNLKLFPWLTASLQAELAQSRHNPNLNDHALIENMEGVKQDDATSMLDSYWRIAANPNPTQADPPDPSGFSFEHFDEQILNINPNADATDEHTQKVLAVDYDFVLANSTEVSIVYAFSPTGLDFSQKTVFEIVLKQDAQSNNLINFHLGGIDEDADKDLKLDTEDVGKDTLESTNDTGELDGILQAEEDIGYCYGTNYTCLARYGADNGFIDSEDLNRNGRLDGADFTGGSFGYNAEGEDEKKMWDATDTSTRTALDFAGGTYHTFQISLDTTTDATAWQAIKQVRVTIGQGTEVGASTGGKISIARIAVVGATWERGKAGDQSTAAGPIADESLLVSAVNNVDNTEYVGRQIYDYAGDAQGVFNDLYGSVDELRQQGTSDNIQEQALKLEWKDLDAGAAVYTKRTFARAVDISQHKNFDFLVFGYADGDGARPSAGKTDSDPDAKVFFLRAGSERDYFEVRVPVNFGGWRKVSVQQVDENDDHLPDRWDVENAPAGTVIISTGNPNLQQIGALTAGIISSGTASDQYQTGAVYLNEIHMANPIIRTGNAYKVQADFTVPGWMSFGGKYRFVDRNFQTPTRTVSNQDNLQETAYLNFTRVKWFPINLNLSYTKVTTPNTNRTGDRSNTVSLLQAGIVRTWNGTASGNLAYKAYPKVSLTHERNRVAYQLARRLDDRKTYRTSSNYSLPWKKFFLPRTIDVNYRFSEYSVFFGDIENRTDETIFNTWEYTNAYGVKLSYDLWKETSFSPSYTATTVREDSLDYRTGAEVRKTYPKSFNQTISFTSRWRLLKWVKPSVSYNVNTIENSVLNVSTFVIAGSSVPYDIGELKTLNRTANGNISLTLNAAEIIPRTRLLRSFSLSNGYRLQDGDVWNNVERDFDARFKLWLRDPMTPGSPVAQRMNYNLRDDYTSTQRWSPLEAYNLTGRKSAFRTFSVTNNFVKSIHRTEKTGTMSKTISTTLPDVIASMNQLEKLTYLEKWVKNFQLTLKYQSRDTHNVAASRETNDSFGSDLRAMIKNFFDTSFGFNLRTSKKEDLRINQVTQTTDHKDATLQSTFDIKKFRFTPKVDYQHDVTATGTGARTQDTKVLTPSLLVRADLAMPKGLAIPFTQKVLKFTNRIIWTTTAKFAIRSSPITQQDNSKLLNFNTSADYEVAKNLRMTLNGAMSRFWHKHLKEEDYISYQFGWTLTFQF